MIEGYALSMGKARTSEWCREQSYIALGFLLSACAHLGIDSCPIEGYNKSEVEKLLGLPEIGLQAATVVPVGYRAKDDAHARENKVRFKKENIVLDI
jgi:nitroreductase